MTPFAADFATTLEKLKLGYQTIVALEGRATAKSELMKDTHPQAAQ